jgi:hypothetical protein
LDKFPAYFVSSTAPNNVEDTGLPVDNPEPTIAEIAKFLCAQDDPEILIAVHGYNTALGKFATSGEQPEQGGDGVKGWCKIFAIAGISLLILAIIAISIVLTLFILRIAGYFRDSYRANNFSVPDLVEFIRQLDKTVRATDPTVGGADGRRIKLSFIGHSMGAFVVTNTMRILSDVFDNDSIGNTSEGEGKAKCSSPNIGRVFPPFPGIAPKSEAVTMSEPGGTLTDSPKLEEQTIQERRQALQRFSDLCEKHGIHALLAAERYNQAILKIVERDRNDY